MTTVSAPKGESSLTLGKVVGTVAKYLVLLLFAVVALVPFVWMISSSLKTSIDVFSIPMRWIPETFHWENYRIIWDRVPLLTYFKNTTVVAIVVTFMQLLTSSFAAYAFAKMTFRGRDVFSWPISRQSRCRGRSI